jgi:hypothetical protein
VVTLLSSSYNILKVQNSVLRGLIAEEFARYSIGQRFPLLVLRPKVIIRYLDDANIQGRTVDFIRKYQQTMDFFGLGPVTEDAILQRTVKDLLIAWFYMIEGLPRFFHGDESIKRLQGFVIEVKSRTSSQAWRAFQYNLSPNQDLMFEACTEVGLRVILCGVTFEADWNMSIVFANHRGKIISISDLLEELTETREQNTT